MAHIGTGHRGTLVVRCLVVIVLGTGLAGCGQAVHIDYANVLWYDGSEYVAQFQSTTVPLAASDLGPTLFTVHRMYRDIPVSAPHQDGDAGILAVGTPVYSVNGYRPTFRLAARFTGQIVLFEADFSTHARTGADLLDIRGKVASIAVLDPQTHQPLGAISAPSAVSSLVEDVLNSPVEATRLDQNVETWVVVFHLRDGTTTMRSYWRDSGLLMWGIETPPGFGQALQLAVASPTPA